MNDLLAVVQWSDSRGQFWCGIVLREDVVVEAASALKFMRGWSRSKVRSFVQARGWTVRVVSQTIAGDRHFTSRPDHDATLYRQNTDGQRDRALDREFRREYAQPCAYCGGDETKCDFDLETEFCSQMSQHGRQ